MPGDRSPAPPTSAAFSAHLRGGDAAASCACAPASSPLNSTAGFAKPRWFLMPGFRCGQSSGVCRAEVGLASPSAASGRGRAREEEPVRELPSRPLIAPTRLFSREATADSHDDGDSLVRQLPPVEALRFLGRRARPFFPPIWLRAGTAAAAHAVPCSHDTDPNFRPLQPGAQGPSRARARRPTSSTSYDVPFNTFSTFA